MKKLLILFLSAAALFAADLQWVEEYDDALLQSKKRHKPIMLMYTMTGCPACKYMKEQVFTKKEVADFINTHFIPVEMNIDFDTVEGLKVYGTPTFYFHWDSKHIIKKIVGGKRADFFLKSLKAIAKEAKALKP